MKLGLLKERFKRPWGLIQLTFGKGFRNKRGEEGMEGKKKNRLGNFNLPFLKDYTKEKSRILASGRREKRKEDAKNFIHLGCMFDLTWQLWATYNDSKA